MRKGKWIMMAAALAVCTFCLPGGRAQTVYAMSGWMEEGGNWRYLQDNGSPVSDAWEKSGDSWYYLGDDGVMAKSSLIDASNGLYYVDENGRRAESQWILADGQHWYYFGSNGKAYRGSTGMKKQIGGKTYVFDQDGAMETGWMDGDGAPLGDGDSPMEDGVYYAGEDGALWKNKWMDYSLTRDVMSEDLSSQPGDRDYSAYSQIWMYFDNNGKRLRSSGDGLRQKVIDGNTYGFDENGVMAPWWSRVASSSNAQPGTPDSSEPVKFYSAYNGGKLLRNSWFWMYPSKGMDAQDNEDQEYSWWHTNDSGDVARDSIKKVNGKYYAFDKIGRMQTGFVLYQNKRNSFVAQYNLDQWTGDDFKTGSILGLEGSHLYLFSPDELNDGSMQTGKNLKVELGDGEYTFGFGSDGVAYGNGNKLERVKDSYYINGLRLDADSDYKYGVVKDQDGSCWLVDASGRRISGDKKVVKDGDGGWIMLLNGKFAARSEDEEKPRWHVGDEGPGFYQYHKDDKDKWGDFLAGYDSQPDMGSLPTEEILYQTGS